MSNRTPSRPYTVPSSLAAGTVETFVDTTDAPSRCDGCKAPIRREEYGLGSVLVNAAPRDGGGWNCPACHLA
jgi:hypothetical protein